MCSILCGGFVYEMVDANASADALDKTREGKLGFVHRSQGRRGDFEFGGTHVLAGRVILRGTVHARGSPAQDFLYS